MSKSVLCYLAWNWEQAKLFPNVLIIMRTHNIYMLVACSYFQRRYRSGVHRLISLIMWTIHLMLKTELAQSSSSSSFYFIMLEMRLTGIGYWLLLERFTYMALWNTWFWLVNRGIQRSDIFSCSLSSMEMLFKINETCTAFMSLVLYRSMDVLARFTQMQLMISCISAIGVKIPTVIKLLYWTTV